MMSDGIYELDWADARDGDPHAMVRVAVHHNRLGDMDEAMSWFTKAAHAGVIDIRAYVGWVCVMKGLTDEATYWLQLAAADGHANSQLMLDSMQSDDSQPEIVASAHMAKILADAGASLGNWAQARDGWVRAASMGNVEAMTLMGMLEKQEGNIGHAILYHERAAMQGSHASMFHLGVVHQERGDAALALEWVTVAAQFGNPDAQEALAKMQF